MTIAAEPVEELVRIAVLDFVKSPAVASSVEDAQRERASDESIVDEVGVLEQRLDDAANAFADGEISRRQLVTASERLNGQLARLRSQLVPQRRLPPIEVPEHAESLWGESLEFRRELVDAAVERVIVSKAQGRGMHANNAERVEVVWR